MNYTCKGPLQFVNKKRSALETTLAELEEKANQLDDDVRAPLDSKIQEVTATLVELIDLDDNHCLGRAGCGHDMTAQIAAIPDDGDVYQYTCPKCGNTGTVRKGQAVEVNDG